MTEKMQTYIQIAVADGSLEEKEIAFLRRKAEELGDDPDEVEMTAKAELAYLKKETESRKSNKEGSVRKCPACGAIVNYSDYMCGACGHEIRNRQISEALKSFFEKYNSSSVQARASIIKSFPIPSTREDILEFLTLSIGNAKSMSLEDRNSYIESAWKGTFKKELYDRQNEISAWQAKVQNAIEKGKAAFRDEETQILLQQYEVKLKENMKTAQEKAMENARKPLKWVALGFLGLFLLIMLPFLFMPAKHNKGVENEKERLNTIVAEIEEAIEENDYKAALMRANNLRWEFDSGWSHVDEYIESWDKKRIDLISQIKEFQEE